jgi:hypothetical protein
MAGGHADVDPAVEFDDFAMDHGLWMDKIWPYIATRIPAFEAVKVISEWAGQYDYNLWTRTRSPGRTRKWQLPVPERFFRPRPAAVPRDGRATAELIVHGGYRTLDMTEFHYGRIAAGRALVEGAII